MTPPSPHEEDDALAGEYALGLLAGAERAAFEARLATDPVLRQRLAAWHEALAPLAEVPAQEPPAAVKRQLDARLFPPRPRRSLWLGLGGLGLAAVLALVLLLPVLTPPAGPHYAAQIASQDAALVVRATYDAATGVMTVERTAGAPAAGRSLELWLLADGAPAPISLGTIDPAVATITLPEPLRPHMPGGTLAISDEPQGGSPTGAPGTVLGAGEIGLT